MIKSLKLLVESNLLALVGREELYEVPAGAWTIEANSLSFLLGARFLGAIGAPYAPGRAARPRVWAQSKPPCLRPATR